MLVAQLCLTLCDPMDCSPSGSSVHGIFQARILECGLPFPPPGDLPHPGIEPGSPAMQADALTIWATSHSYFKSLPNLDFSKLRWTLIKHKYLNYNGIMKYKNIHFEILHIWIQHCMTLQNENTDNNISSRSQSLNFWTGLINTVKARPALLSLTTFLPSSGPSGFA